MRFLLLGSLLLAAGCFSPKYGNGDLKCQSGAHPCPEGFQCAPDNTCWKTGSDLGSSHDMSSTDMTPTAVGNCVLDKNHLNDGCSLAP